MDLAGRSRQPEHWKAKIFGQQIISLHYLNRISWIVRVGMEIMGAKEDGRSGRMNTSKIMVESIRTPVIRIVLIIKVVGLVKNQLVPRKRVMSHYRKV